MSSLSDFSVACKAWYQEGLGNLSDVDSLHVFCIKDANIQMKDAISGSFVSDIPTSADSPSEWISSHGGRSVERGNIIRVSNNNVLAEIFNNTDGSETSSTFVLVKKETENETITWKPLACAHLSMDYFNGSPRYVSFAFIGTNNFMRVEFDPNASALYYDLTKFFENRELFTITLGAYRNENDWVLSSLQCTYPFTAELYGMEGSNASPITDGVTDCTLKIFGDIDYTHIMFEAVGVTGSNALLCHQGKDMRCICPVVSGKNVSVDLTEVLNQWVQTEDETSAPDVIIIRGYGMHVSGSSSDPDGLHDITYGWVTGNAKLGTNPILLGSNGIDGSIHSDDTFYALGYCKYNDANELMGKTDENTSPKHADDIKIHGSNADRTQFLISKDNKMYFLDEDAVSYTKHPNVNGVNASNDILYEHVYVKVPSVFSNSQVMENEVTLQVGSWGSSGVYDKNAWLDELKEDDGSLARRDFQKFNCESMELPLVGNSGENSEISDPTSYGKPNYFNAYVFNPALIIGIYRRNDNIIGYMLGDQSNEGKVYVISGEAFVPDIFTDNENKFYVGDILDGTFNNSAMFDVEDFFNTSITQNFIIPMLRRCSENDFSVTHPTGLPSTIQELQTFLGPNVTEVHSITIPNNESNNGIVAPGIALELTGNPTCEICAVINNVKVADHYNNTYDKNTFYVIKLGDGDIPQPVYGASDSGYPSSDSVQGTQARMCVLKVSN